MDIDMDMMMNWKFIAIYLFISNFAPSKHSISRILLSRLTAVHEDIFSLLSNKYDRFDITTTACAFKYDV